MVLLDEGGHDEPYTRSATRKERYLKVPHAYWTDSLHLKLSLPAKVMLLIALSLDDGFPLPVARAKDWYGISSDTVKLGRQHLAELANLNLINVDEQYRRSRSRPTATRRTAASP